MNERAFSFRCMGAELLGIVHQPASEAATTGLLFLTGGDQYRVGAHRQYVRIARRLAAEGFPVMRFDDRGNGDSKGERYTNEFDHFEAASDDLHAAADVFAQECPSLEKIVLWGMCGAVSTFLLSPRLPASVAGLVLVNPWVRTEAGAARTYLRHYYLERLFDADFWRKLVSGRLSPGTSIKSFFSFLGQSRPQGRSESEREQPLPDRMAGGFARYAGPALFILSGRDYTAQEFKDLVAQSPTWRNLMARPGIARRDHKEADHTFSTGPWHRQLEAWTLEFVSAVALGKAMD